MVDVHTVGAGGGSVAWRDAGGALRAGPALGGRRPWPRVLRPRGHRAHGDRRQPAAGLPGRRLVAGRRRGAGSRRGGSRPWASWRIELGLEPDETAAGIVRVAGAEMAQAVRVVTVERGVDPRDLALVAFGGAGPCTRRRSPRSWACGAVIAPVASGVLSALGLAVSERRRDLQESVLLSGEEFTAEAVAAVVERLVERGREELGTEGGELRATYELRYAGQAFELPIEGSTRPDPAEPARRLRPRARRALRLRGSRGAAGAGHRAGGGRAAGRRGRAGTGGPAERRGERRARFAASGSTPPCWVPARASRPGRPSSSCRVDAGGAARVVGARRRRDGGDGAMSVASTRSPCR